MTDGVVGGGGAGQQGVAHTEAVTKRTVATLFEQLLTPPPRPPRGWRGPLLGIGLLVLAQVVMVVLVVTQATARLDEVTFPWFTALDQPGWQHRVPRTVVWAGQFWSMALVVVVSAAVVSWRRRHLRPLVVSGAAMVALDAVLLVVKLATGRPAPHTGINAVFAGGMSYPSGHAAHGTLGPLLLASLLGLVLPARAGARRVWEMPRWSVWTASAVALATGLSTLILGYHWVMEGLAGWALGLSLFVAAHWLQQVPTTEPRAGGGVPVEVPSSRPAVPDHLPPTDAIIDHLP